MCPWENFCQARLLFCETVLCSWIRQPSNAYSSLAYIAVGILLFRISRSIAPLPGSLSGKLFGVTSIILGLGSFIFHATGTCLGGELDYLGMFLVTGLLTGLNVRRLLGISWAFTYAIILLTAVLLHTLSCFFPLAARLIFAFGSPCCALEVVLWIRRKNSTFYKMYWISWGTMTVGFIFWMLDQSSLLCNSENHWLNGHAAWHFFTAVSLIPLAIFYMQFPNLQMSGENLPATKK